MIEPIEIKGEVVAGHGVASGRSGDPRFPGGTLALQWPIFVRRGLELEGFFKGTINVSVAPLAPLPITPTKTFRDVSWHPEFTEDFSFFAVRISVSCAPPTNGYIYWPHPETKPDHFQDRHVVEVLAPEIKGVENGAPLRIWADPKCMRFVG